MKTKTRRVFHMTPLVNLPSILSSGYLLPDSLAKPLSNFGDPEIKAKRKKIRVAVEPGGNLSDYTPFYFTSQTPMLYQNIAKFKVKQSSLLIIQLEFEPNEVAFIEGAKSIVVSAHPLSNQAVIKCATADNLKNTVNWPVVFSKDPFSIPGIDIHDWKLFRQAELLLHKGLKIDSPNVKLLVRSDDALARVDQLIAEAGLDIYAAIDESLFYHTNLHWLST